jgi:putative intracellular protease/amidase
MPAPVAALAGALLLGGLNTFGDFVWARYVASHRTVFGLAHGTLLLMAVGLYLGVLRRRAALGALAGALVGLLAAASFYALAPLLGYRAMVVSWMALWIGFALVDARLSGRAPLSRDVVVRGLLAALGSGLAFWAISGIWTHPAPGGPRYAYNFLCWTVAFLPGFAALLLRGRTGPS